MKFNAYQVYCFVICETAYKVRTYSKPYETLLRVKMNKTKGPSNNNLEMPPKCRLRMKSAIRKGFHFLSRIVRASTKEKGFKGSSLLATVAHINSGTALAKR